MALFAGHSAFDPTQPLAVGYNANIFVLGLKNRALFDVQFKHGMHFAGTDFFVTDPANARQFVTKAFAL